MSDTSLSPLARTAYRPRRTAHHPRPTRGWLNDPNGVVRHRGRWHVFFQHNPAVARHGDIHWGHLSSTDLVRWTEHQVAFGPQPGGPDRQGAWSGVAVPGSDPVQMVYTAVADGTATTTVCLREALDDELLTWSDPEVVAHTPRDAGVAEMRDPYVFDWQGRRFALMGAGMTDGTAAVLLFSCDDIRDWTYEGVWLRSGDPGLAVEEAQVWECPQLLQMGDSWVLMVSLVSDAAPNGVWYLTGSVVGSLADNRAGPPHFVVRASGRADAGRQFYAPQAVPDAGNDPLLFGWIIQPEAPMDSPWETVAGCLTLPRRLRLDGDRLTMAPDPGLAQAMVPRHPTSVDLAFGRAALPMSGRVLVRPAGAPAVEVLLSSGDTVVPLTLDQHGAEVWLDADVVEVFGPDRVPLTVRALRGDRWSLSGEALLDLSAASFPIG